VTYVPDATAQRYAIRRAGRAGNPVGLEKLARRVRTVEQATTAAAADAIAARQLKVSIGAPLLRVRAALRDADRNLLAVQESLFRPDRVHLRATFGRRPGKSAARWRLKSR
jgi:DNA-binding GntR family transcriptional regulator